MAKIQKFPDNSPKPITVLSVGHPKREKRTIERVILPLVHGDFVSRSALAYWLIDVPQDDNGEYNGQIAYNDALWECESPFVIFSTGDSIIPPELLWRAYGVHLETMRPITTVRADQISEDTLEATANNHAIGDFILTPRQWAVAAGGWDERLTNWGLSDYVFCALLEAAGHPPVLLGNRWEDRVIHLWHPCREDSWYKEQNRKNRALVNSMPMWTKADFMEGRERRVEEVLV